MISETPAVQSTTSDFGKAVKLLNRPTYVHLT